MNRRRLSAVLLVIALGIWGLAGAQSGGPERAWITILSTTDLHGNILPIDYYTGQR